MIQTILTIWLFTVVILSFIKIKWGVALFLLYFILIPGFNIGIEGLGQGQNIMFFVVLVAYLFYSFKNNIKSDFKILSPFFVLYIVLFFEIPFQDEMNFGDKIYYWLKEAMGSLILPFVVLNVMKYDTSSIKTFKHIMIFCIVLIVCYGLFQTSIGGANPYTMSFVGILDIDQKMESYYINEGSGRLFGRISSFFIHPMAFAMFLGCSIIYLVSLIKTNKSFKLVLLLFASVALGLICGVRSVIGGLVIASIYYMIVVRNFKVLIYTSISVVLLVTILSYFPDLQNYIYSIIDSKSSNVSGSSLEMRLTQLNGAVSLMMQNPLFGLGTGWTTYYVTIHGDHPVCLAFESLIMVIICNNGIIGVIIWIYLIFKYLQLNNSKTFVDGKIIQTLLIFYISYSTITGDYGYMKYFLLFYVMTISESYNKQIKCINQDELYSSNYRIVSPSISSHS